MHKSANKHGQFRYKPTYVLKWSMSPGPVLRTSTITCYAWREISRMEDYFGDYRTKKILWGCQSSRNGVLCIATGCTVCGSNPGSGKWVTSFPKLPDMPWGPPNLRLSYYRVSICGLKTNTQLHPLSTLRMSGVIPLLPLYAFKAQSWIKKTLVSIAFTWGGGGGEGEGRCILRLYWSSVGVDDLIWQVCTGKHIHCTIFRVVWATCTTQLIEIS
jgi:hypothetical protein